MTSPTSEQELIERITTLLGERPFARLLVCRPADWSDYPPTAQPDALGVEISTLDPGWIDIPCEVCGITARMGVRQRAVYEALPSTFFVVDMICAARMATLSESTTLTHLGGA